MDEFELILRKLGTEKDTWCPFNSPPPLGQAAGGGRCIGNRCPAYRTFEAVRQGETTHWLCGMVPWNAAANTAYG